MLPIAGQMAGPIGLKFFWTLMGCRGLGSVIGKKNRLFSSRRAFQLVFE